MSRIGRYAKATAKPGQADALAERLREVAEGMRSLPGCELYVVNRQVDDPDAEEIDVVLGGSGPRLRGDAEMVRDRWTD